MELSVIVLLAILLTVNAPFAVLIMHYAIDLAVQTMVRKELARLEEIERFLDEQAQLSRVRDAV